MNILEKLSERWKGVDYPFLIHSNRPLKFDEVINQQHIDLSEVRSGDVVALIGDFNPQSILTFLQLIDKNVILVPLTVDTRSQHEYFFESALVDVVIEGGNVKRINHSQKHELIDSLRSKEHAGLVLFSTGTTGRPKAILHDLTLFMQRFELHDQRSKRSIFCYLITLVDSIHCSIPCSIKGQWLHQSHAVLNTYWLHVLNMK